MAIKISTSTRARESRNLGFQLQNFKQKNCYNEKGYKRNAYNWNQYWLLLYLICSAEIRHGSHNSSFMLHPQWARRRYQRGIVINRRWLVFFRSSQTTKEPSEIRLRTMQGTRARKNENTDFDMLSVSIYGISNPYMIKNTMSLQVVSFRKFTRRTFVRWPDRF